MKGWLAWCLNRKPVRYLLLAAFLLLTAVAAWNTASLRLNGDMSALLADSDPAVLAYQAVLRDLPELDSLDILCQAAGSDGLVASLQTLAGVVSVIPGPQSLAQERLLRVQLSTPPSDIPATREILQDIRGHIITADAQCRFGGVPAFLAESSAVLDRDLLQASLIAIIGIFAFFLFVYRGLGLFTVTLVPVLAGIVWGLGASALFTQQITLLAATVPTLLFGIGIDFGIHQAHAARVQARDGKARLDAIVEGWSQVSRPITIGALTTTLAFLALMASDLRGLSDLGQTGALVTTGVYLANMSLMPLLLATWPLERMDRQTPLDRGLARSARWVTSAGRWILGVTMLISLLALAGIFRLEVQQDARKLEPETLEARTVETILASDFGLGGSPTVVRTNRDGLQRLYRLFHAEPERWPSILSLTPVPGAGIALAYTRGDPFQSAPWLAFTGDLADLANLAGVDYQLSGSAVLNRRIDDLLRTDWPWIFSIAGVSIGAVLLLLAGARGGLLLLLPLLAGVVWILGAMGWLGVGASVMSAAVFPLVFGLGIDDGAHVILYRRGHSWSLASLYRDRGVALLATTVTTVIAFGAFAFSETRGLAQFGTQAAAGLTVCLAVSLLTLPLLLKHSGHETGSDGGSR